MGMTDRQFDSYNKRILRYLEEIKEQAVKSGLSIKQLDVLIDDIKDELQRP